MRVQAWLLHGVGGPFVVGQPLFVNLRDYIKRGLEVCRSAARELSVGFRSLQPNLAVES